MKFFLLPFILTALLNSVVAQHTTAIEYTAIDKKALAIPDSLTRSAEGIATYINSHFITENEKARAAFIWVATHIQYDVEDMFKFNLYEDVKDSVTLKFRKGTCKNYAALFNNICLKSGIKSYSIIGYTRQNGIIDNTAHGWCAARIDSLWYLFDPTWAAGTKKEGTYIEKINKRFYKVSPQIMLQTHMPYDYLWQFVNYPITNREFYSSQLKQTPSKPFFNYEDSIAAYEKMDEMEQIFSAARRIEANGVINALIYNKLRLSRFSIEAKNFDIYFTANVEHSQGINLYNDFILYKNNRFLPQKSDTAIQQMITASLEKLNRAKTTLNPDYALEYLNCPFRVSILVKRPSNQGLFFTGKEIFKVFLLA